MFLSTVHIYFEIYSEMRNNPPPEFNVWEKTSKSVDTFILKFFQENNNAAILKTF